MGTHTRQEYIALAFDPGRDKTGFAFMNTEGSLLASGIFTADEAYKLSSVRQVH